MIRRAGIILGIIYTILPNAARAQEELPPAPDQPPSPVSSSLLDGFLLMSNETLLMTVAGIIVSLIMTIPLKQSWAPDLKAFLVFLVCVGFGIVYTLTLDEWSSADLGRRVLLVMAAATGFYLIFKGPMQTLTARTDDLLNRT